MNTIYKWLMLAALPCAAAAPMQAQKTYSLDECRTMAIENNVKTRNAANTLEAARQARKEAFTGYFPTVSASGMGYNANKGLLQLDMAPGMSMSLLKNGIMAGVTATQPVFAGGQIVNGNRLAETAVEEGRIRQEESENEVRLTVEQYYWQVVTLQEKLNTLRTVEQQLERINKDVEAAVQAGVTTRNDLLQVQLRLGDTKSKRINLQNGLHTSRMLLAQYVGLDADTIAVESHIPMDTVPEFPKELYVDHDAALTSTTGYRLSETSVRAEKLRHKMAVGQNLPSVAVGAGYMYDDLIDKSHPFAVGFVSVSVPLSGWWGGSHAIKRQKLQVRNAENQLADNSRLLVIAMQRAWDDLQDSYKQIGIAHNSIGQAAENLRLNENYYHAGTTTMGDLLDAQTMYQQSRDKFVDAYATFSERVSLVPSFSKGGAGWLVKIA